MRRCRRWAFLCVLGACFIALALVPLPSAAAARRNPQVPISGTALEAFFNSQGEAINAAQDQVAGELFFAIVGNNSTFTLQVEMELDAGNVESGIYGGHEANPVLIPVFMPGAHAGSFGVVSFRTNPTRFIVNRFDETAAFLGSTTYPGGDRKGIGWYVRGPLGPFYSQDARNVGGAPQVLYYQGTGINAGSWWVTAETSPAGAGNADYADIVWLFDGGFLSLVDTHPLRWAQLKARFR